MDFIKEKSMTIGEAVQKLQNAPQHLEFRANVDDTNTKVTLVGYNPEDGTELELVSSYKRERRKVPFCATGAAS